MVTMVNRSILLRLLGALVLPLVLAGCGAPLSDSWDGYRTGPATEQGSPTKARTSPRDAPEPPGPDCSLVKCVALTFDDGPGTYTESLLDLLDEHQAKATFFLIGENVAKHPGVVRDELDRGHELGNHTFSHRDLTKMSLAAAQRELRKTDAAIKKATGEEPTLIRPPFGAIPTSLKKTLDVPVALWSVDTLDWQTRDTKKTVKAAEKVEPGSIVLMHDIHESTIKAMPRILTDLQAKGYHFVTVSELISKPKPGIGYGTGQHPATKN
ncbi:polysaccharide deacetylase family protein [Paeniglutamicibacter antarcticus]|uniref:NodB homology domain-containing protein n=1 Tax=Paeniglutamicibacter antarcticus TaxID=494023 RepID=A0ABP9TMR8_9MICC